MQRITDYVQDLDLKVSFKGPGIVHSSQEAATRGEDYDRDVPLAFKELVHASSTVSSLCRQKVTLCPSCGCVK